ncbi:PREDICTED: protein FAM163B [Gavialis gangeticus]|uniref:protein FAM163B n=1 Tax=Gavialis gangeticus TaxID=94835 RepID=UPI00092EA190|nr:PREDICTED: protein FAM163B [Gavialis gangeticus]XP_019366311.1 PREDICTED: protein FAM163B [Gavialis gangeticus]
MTAGTVVITGGILATVILLCIIAVLCYCRLQYYCCKKDESEEDEEEPDFAVHSHIPPLHSNRNVVLTNGPSVYAASSPFHKKHSQCRTVCPSCSQYEPPTFFLQQPPEEVRNGGDRVSYKNISQEDIELPVSVSNLQALNPNRLSAMREAFSRSRSISTDV